MSPAHFRCVNVLAYCFYLNEFTLQYMKSLKSKKRGMRMLSPGAAELWPVKSAAHMSCDHIGRTVSRPLHSTCQAVMYRNTAVHAQQNGTRHRWFFGAYQERMCTSVEAGATSHTS